jgi:tRNA(fMet)-specific endonuclease VapC
VLYLLDTDIASYAIKSKSAKIEHKLATIPPAQLCISVITRAELLYGLKRVQANHPLQALVRQYLRIIRVLAWESEAADYYAEIRHQLVSTGRSIGDMDIMIAAHALALGATLVTNNIRHYERIQAPLLLENWTL